MREHQVVVVFDVTAPDILSAGRGVVGFLNGTRGRSTLPDRLIADSVIESWWMPEEPLRSQVDRNDNGAMHLEPTEPPLDIYVEDDAEDEPTIWRATDNPERPKALLSHCAFARLVGGDDDALPLWHRLTAGLPTAPPVGQCGHCGKRTDEWPPRECEEPEQHTTATYGCDCGETVTIAEAIANPEKHRRCNLIGADR